jgi:eukaryotic-like serine/threonine-protein kinase
MHDCSDPNDPPTAGLPDGYSRLRELFDAVLEQTDADRSAWIDAHVADPVEREALLRLLAADAGSGLLETPADERATLIGDDPAAWESGWLGQRVGPFRLTRTLGHGGMAAVFLGEREGVDFHQQVAVKILRRGLFSEAEQALFRRERKALAMLSHPNIAHLIDGGVTRTGIPYLAMEYVDGVSITRHIADQRLSLPKRLSLFVLVCHAVAAAHRLLIVHRDIKPSNILVTDAGEVKLLDFGIAKLLDDDDEEATRTGFAVLTRGYAAPEQFSGAPISTATDVYALGVLLHEMLLGERPDEGNTRPSTRAAALTNDAGAMPLSPLAMRAALRGDLDNILGMAMATEPWRRYGSAAELADDIERHQQALPVRAHPPSVWYRTRKFVRRHSGGVALTLAFALALLASLAIAVWQAKVAHDNARAALREVKRAGEIQDFLEGLFRPLQDGTATSKAPTVVELVARGRAQLDLRYPDDPRVRADLLAMFARINDGMGETIANRELAEAAWHANEAAYGSVDVRTLTALEFHARVLRRIGDYPAAIAAMENVRSIMRAHGIGGQPYARALDALSVASQYQGIDPAEAIRLQREALDTRLADPAATAGDRASGYNNLGGAYQYAGDYNEAGAWYAKALALNRDNLGDSIDTATTQMNLARAIATTSSWRAAATLYDDTRAIFRRIPIDRHPALISLLLRQCSVLVDLEDLSAARPVCDEAVTKVIDLDGPEHRNHALVLAQRARLYLASGEVGAARADYDQARVVANMSTSERGKLLGAIDASEARLWWLTGDNAKLRDAMLSLLSPDRSAGARLGTRAPDAPLYASLAALACRRAPIPPCGNDRAILAEQLLAEPRFAHSPQRLPARIAMAELALANGAPGPAIAPLAKVLAELESELGPAHSLRAQSYRMLAAMREITGDRAGAHADSDRAADAMAQLPAGHPLHTWQPTGVVSTD